MDLWVYARCMYINLLYVLLNVYASGVLLAFPVMTKRCVLSDFDGGDCNVILQC